MKKLITFVLVLAFLLVPVSSAFAYGGDNENVDHVRFRCTTHPEFEINDGVPLYSPSLTYPLIWDEIKAHRAEHTVTRWRPIRTRTRINYRRYGRWTIKWVKVTYCPCRIEIAEMDANNNVVEIVNSNYIPWDQR